MALNMQNLRTPGPKPEGGSNVTTLTKDAEAPAAPKLADFMSGSADDRLTDLLAFALAAEGEEPAASDRVERLRRRAAAELADHAARAMHNRIEEIRRDAVAEHIGALRRPLGFVGTALANLVAIGAAVGLWWWIAGDPAMIARLSAMVGR